MYSIKLSDNEMKTLAWMTDRGYFPDTLYDGFSLKDGELDPDINNGRIDPTIERVWTCEEHEAWSLIEMRDNDSEAYLNCLGGILLEKVLAFESEIV